MAAAHSSGTFWFTDAIIAKHYGEAEARMVTAPRIRIDDVASYYLSGTSQEVWQPEDYPFLIPPYDALWLEGRLPNTISSDVYGLQDNKGPLAVAEVAAYIQRSDACGGRLRDSLPRSHVAAMPANARHILSMSLYCRTTWNQDLIPDLVVMRFLDDSGAMIGTDGKFGINITTNAALRLRDRAIAKGIDPNDFVREYGRLVMAAAGNPSFLALSFLNCRNSDVDETTPARAFRRQMERSNQPLARYYVLSIPAIRKATSERMSITGESLQRALHFCRGHFATYTDEHPLFGKHVGRFWKPAHVRGQSSSGVVVKDYALKT